MATCIFPVVCDSQGHFAFYPLDKHGRTLKRTLILIITALVVLIAALSWKVADGVWATIQVSFADEQTELFAEMVEKASEAIHQEPPDVESAVEFLRSAHNYYPSGTKQTTGSALDRIVERSRSNAERQIIAMLREITGADLGRNPNAWIDKFGGEADAER